MPRAGLGPGRLGADMIYFADWERLVCRIAGIKGKFTNTDLLTWAQFPGLGANTWQKSAWTWASACEGLGELQHKDERRSGSVSAIFSQRLTSWAICVAITSGTDTCREEHLHSEKVSRFH